MHSLLGPCWCILLTGGLSPPPFLHVSLLISAPPSTGPHRSSVSGAQDCCGLNTECSLQVQVLTVWSSANGSILRGFGNSRRWGLGEECVCSPRLHLTPRMFFALCSFLPPLSQAPRCSSQAHGILGKPLETVNKISSPCRLLFATAMVMVRKAVQRQG